MGQILLRHANHPHPLLQCAVFSGLDPSCLSEPRFGLQIELLSIAIAATSGAFKDVLPGALHDGVSEVAEFRAQQSHDPSCFRSTFETKNSA